MSQTHEQAKQVQGDHKKAHELMLYIKSLYKYVDLFRGRLHTFIVDSLIRLGRVNEFPIVDFPLIRSFEEMFSDIRDIIYRYKNTNGLLRPPSLVYGPVPIIDELMTFDGRLSQWQEFKSNFTTLVHTENSLALEQRYSLLLSVLSGPPLEIANSFPNDSANYYAAWTTVCYNYEFEFIGGMCCIENIYQSQTVCLDLATFTNVFHVQIGHLQTLCRNDLADFVKSYPYTRLINPVTPSNTSRTDASPNFRLLIEFANQQGLGVPENAEWNGRNAIAAALGGPAAQDARPIIVEPAHVAGTTVDGHAGQGPTADTGGPTEAVLAAAVSQPSNKCTFCGKTDDHVFCDCVAFKRLSLQPRKKFVFNNRLCYVCLSSSHTKNECKSATKCAKCGGRHHRCLHSNRASCTSAKRRQAVKSMLGADTSPSEDVVCLLCGNPQHKFWECADFLGLSVKKRRTYIFKWSLCYLCLSPLHKLNDCDSSRMCVLCGKRHHKSLHPKLSL